MSKINLPWVDKYRPSSFNEIVSQKDIIKTIENLKKNDPDLCSSIDNLKNQILYNKSNEI